MFLHYYVNNFQSLKIFQVAKQYWTIINFFDSIAVNTSYILEIFQPILTWNIALTVRCFNFANFAPISAKHHHFIFTKNLKILKQLTSLILFFNFSGEIFRDRVTIFSTVLSYGEGNVALFISEILVFGYNYFQYKVNF